MKKTNAITLPTEEEMVPQSFYAEVDGRQIQVWFEHVGPARAEELLGTYHVNYRKLRPSYALALGTDMEAGNWNFDGSPVRIDEHGNLFDGQHRLTAIRESNTFQWIMFVANLPQGAYLTTDTGLARNYGDSLRMRGYTNVSARASLTKLIARWDQDRNLDSSRRLTNAVADEYHDKYADRISRAVALAGNDVRKIPVPLSVVAFTWFTLLEISVEKAHEFMGSLSEGDSLPRGNPILTLRNRLMRDISFSYTRMQYMYMIFSAWNAFLEGRELNVINVPTTLTRSNMVEPTRIGRP